ncbi:MAG: zinc metallopeptidase, partial [Actinomycetia bacterium]|nr:zinc metallopeptidase [Actinomycetes bacterium]
IVTLPVEFNASRRAMVMLENGGYIAQEEYKPAKQVLNAAALTYLAATLAAIMQLVYYLILSRRN